MSLNRYEQTLFDYLERNPEERKHWQLKVQEATKAPDVGIDAARGLERELWNYFRERGEHVPALRQLNASTLPRVSLQNLADFLVRLWGPPPKEKKKPSGPPRV